MKFDIANHQAFGGYVLNTGPRNFKENYLTTCTKCEHVYHNEYP